LELCEFRAMMECVVLCSSLGEKSQEIVLLHRFPECRFNR
jgi:hypothetical protein